MAGSCSRGCCLVSSSQQEAERQPRKVVAAAAITGEFEHTAFCLCFGMKHLQGQKGPPTTVFDYTNR